MQYLAATTANSTMRLADSHWDLQTAKSVLVWITPPSYRVFPMPISLSAMAF